VYAARPRTAARRAWLPSPAPVAEEVVPNLIKDSFMNTPRIAHWQGTSSQLAPVSPTQDQPLSGGPGLRDLIKVRDTVRRLLAEEAG
jgi:hypothetical protein